MNYRSRKCQQSFKNKLDSKDDNFKSNLGETLYLHFLPLPRAKDSTVVCSFVPDTQSKNYAPSKACFDHIRDLRRIRPYHDLKAVSTIATALVHSKLNYFNSLYLGLSKQDWTRSPPTPAAVLPLKDCGWKCVRLYDGRCVAYAADGANITCWFPAAVCRLWSWR